MGIAQKALIPAEKELNDAKLILEEALRAERALDQIWWGEQRGKNKDLGEALQIVRKHRAFSLIAHNKAEEKIELLRSAAELEAVAEGVAPNAPPNPAEDRL
jgi:hypothetical protein